jgi:hypothetical protein
MCTCKRAVGGLVLATVRVGGTVWIAAEVAVGLSKKVGGLGGGGGGGINEGAAEIAPGTVAA